MVMSHLRGKLLIIWIPAFAGMTIFDLMDNPGLPRQLQNQLSLPLKRLRSQSQVLLFLHP